MQLIKHLLFFSCVSLLVPQGIFAMQEAPKAPAVQAVAKGNVGSYVAAVVAAGGVGAVYAGLSQEDKDQLKAMVSNNKGKLALGAAAAGSLYWLGKRLFFTTEQKDNRAGFETASWDDTRVLTEADKLAEKDLKPWQVRLRRLYLAIYEMAKPGIDDDELDRSERIMNKHINEVLKLDPYSLLSEDGEFIAVLNAGKRNAFIKVLEAYETEFVETTKAELMKSVTAEQDALKAEIPGLIDLSKLFIDEKLKKSLTIKQREFVQAALDMLEVYDRQRAEFSLTFMTGGVLNLGETQA